MSAKEPVIRFSPFEALLIGEKNRILKQQPMKNTIYVTRLNQKRRTINLRDLFGPETNTQSNYNNVIFKMPQRVCDFLRHRRLRNTNNHSPYNNKSDILCYEFEGHKIITKNNKTLLPKFKNNNNKVKPVKVKYKRTSRYKNKVNDKIVKKFASSYESKYQSVALKSQNKNPNKVKRHLLRGKDGKFICKSEYENLKFKEDCSKQKYLSHYVDKLYLNENKKLYNNSQTKRWKSSLKLKMPYSIETIVELSKLQFNNTASKKMLDEILEKYYGNNCLKDFKYPNLPTHLKSVDFENDSYLIDLIYEDFPNIIRFQSPSQSNDFSEALLECQILKPEKNLKMYKKKKNRFVKDNKVREVLNGRLPLIKLRRINDIMPNHCNVKNEKNYYASKIDEPYTKKSHLITEKNFGRFFFKSAEGKDIFIGNLMKPFWQNSWFGSLPES